MHGRPRLVYRCWHRPPPAAGTARGAAAGATPPSAAASDDGMLPWHHLPDGTFRNPPGSPERGGSPADWRAFFWRRLVARAPAPALPDGHVLSTEAAAWPGIAAAVGRDSVTWLGHASFLIRLGGRTILTDPFLTERASPLPWFGPQRIAGPGLPPELLPPIDLLLLSHNHYDHLDLRALARLRGAGRTSVVMPLRLSRYLDTGRFAAGDRAGLAAAGGDRRRPDHRLARDPFQQARPVRPQRQPVVRLPARGRRPPHPVHRRHRLRPGVRRDRAAAGPRRTWPWCRSAPTSRAR